MSIDQALATVRKMSFSRRRTFFIELEKLAQARLAKPAMWPDLILYVVPSDLSTALARANE
jgi:hypothetical protein